MVGVWSLFVIVVIDLGTEVGKSSEVLCLLFGCES